MYVWRLIAICLFKISNHMSVSESKNRRYRLQSQCVSVFSFIRQILILPHLSSYAWNKNSVIKPKYFVSGHKIDFVKWVIIITIPSLNPSSQLFFAWLSVIRFVPIISELGCSRLCWVKSCLKNHSPDPSLETPSNAWPWLVNFSQLFSFLTVNRYKWGPVTPL